MQDGQLKTWREEQQFIASRVLTPNQCSFTTTVDVCNGDTSGFGDEYQHRYSHCIVSETKKSILIGGVDVAFPIDPNQQAIAVYVIILYPTLLTAPTVVYRSHKHFNPLPYISSYLSFRESPTLLSLISEQLETQRQFRPDVIMVDGNGRWHQRRAGLACFIGQCGIPCIGVGKTWYDLNGVELDVKRAVEKSIVEWYCSFEQRGVEEGSRCVVFDSVSFGDTSSDRSTSATPEQMLPKLHAVAYGLAIPMVDETNSNKETLAYALLGHGGHFNKQRSKGSKNPIYISVGNNIALKDAVALVAYTCGVSRVPEPVREADLYGRCLLRDTNEGNGA